MAVFSAQPLLITPGAHYVIKVPWHPELRYGPGLLHVEGAQQMLARRRGHLLGLIDLTAQLFTGALELEFALVAVLVQIGDGGAVATLLELLDINDARAGP